MKRRAFPPALPPPDPDELLENQLLDAGLEDALRLLAEVDQEIEAAQSRGEDYYREED